MSRFIGSTEWSHGAFFDVKNPMEVGFPAAVPRDSRQASNRHLGQTSPICEPPGGGGALERRHSTPPLVLRIGCLVLAVGFARQRVRSSPAQGPNRAFQ